MLHNIVALTKKFISIKSTPENSKDLEGILNLALSNLKEYTIERFEHGGVKSALIYNTRHRPKKFKIILNGHLDIIPGKERQYAPRVHGSRLYGVGAMDMKASVACLIIAFKEVANKIDYPLGLQLVTDEEIGGFNGTKHQIDKGVKADFVIVGESTGLNIENETKGILWVKISAKGKAAHGAYPWKGENAIWDMYRFLNQVEKKYPLPKKEEWITTVNLANIETKNQTFNKIPDYCEVWLDVRYIPEDGVNIVNNIKRLLPKGFGLTVIAKEPALSTDENNHNIKLLKATIKQTTRKQARILCAHGSSDARHFVRVGCPAIEFGPSGGGMGADNEWVDIPSLEKYYQTLRNFLMSLAKK
ncbi:MAG: M20/M25/M40 family metallo-hydrolase [Methanocellales archaeon]|nr:M20/M25/M40 family metallo-hydrolase [Methanocellales archaeon]